MKNIPVKVIRLIRCSIGGVNGLADYHNWRHAAACCDGLALAECILRCGWRIVNGTIGTAELGRNCWAADLRNSYLWRNCGTKTIGGTWNIADRDLVAELRIGRNSFLSELEFFQFLRDLSCCRN